MGVCLNTVAKFFIIVFSSRYRNPNSALEANISNHGASSLAGTGGMSYVGEVCH